MSEFYKGRKIEIHPTDFQKQLIARYIELYRYVYNWALDQERLRYTNKQQNLEQFGFYTKYELYVLYTTYKHDNPWLNELPIGIARNALADAVNSYMNFLVVTIDILNINLRSEVPKCLN